MKKIISRKKIEKIIEEEKQKNIEKLEGIVYIVLMFILFSMLGWVWELLYDFLKHGVIANHGVLHGPWLPIYGGGGVFMYLVLNRFKKNSLIVFMGAFVFCTIIEYCTAWYLETLKHHKWWSYVNMPFNIDGRICLLASIFFGIGGLACIYVFAPNIKAFMKKFELKKVAVVCFLLFTLFTIDFIYSDKHPNLVEKYKIIDTEKVEGRKLFNIKK